MKIKYGHYTSIPGLLGIIDKGNLWATNIRFLNDEQEFKHALDLIKNVIPNSRITREQPEHPIHKQFIQGIQSELKSLDDYKSDSVFTLSFSEETDLLSQWRGYCAINSGYCIEFDAEKILQSAKNNFKEARLLKCIYKNEEKDSLIKKLLNTYWEKYDSPNNNEIRKHIFEELKKELLFLASHFKHPSFSEEKEHRVVIVVEYESIEKVLFREGRSSLVPYISIPETRDAIKNVTIGPTSNKNLSQKALEMLLEKTFGYPRFMSEISILHSDTPYRTW